MDELNFIRKITEDGFGMVPDDLNEYMEKRKNADPESCMICHKMPMCIGVLCQSCNSRGMDE